MLTTFAARRSHSVRRAGAALATVLAGLFVAGCSTSTRSDTPGRVGSSADQTGSSASSARVAPHSQWGLSRSIPTKVDIPAIAVHSSLVQLGLNSDKSVQVPPVREPLQAGWYKYGPTPGQAGPAVILGHIDGDHHEGIFWRLHEVRRGDKVRISRKDGKRLAFTVTNVTETAKRTFPTNAVYGDTPDPQLRLITCGGAFDATAHSYVDNIIVYATMDTNH